MKLPPNVKIKPRLWEFLPWLSKYTAQAIYPNIYFSKEAYKKLVSGDPVYIAALIHEQEHIKRQKGEGWLKWVFKYIFSGKFRFNEEIAAIKPSMKYLKKKKIGFDIEKKAKILSGWLYFWPVSYEIAERGLKRVWRGI